MKVLVTGSNGFIGKNLVVKLKELGHEVFEFDIDTPKEKLQNYVRSSEFIFHLAGINRPKDEKEFFEGNLGSTEDVISILERLNLITPIVITSSIQANLDNSYGKSKKAAEEIIKNYREKTGVGTIYRLPNVFGKWCRPNYNSAIATFCNNIANGQEVWISDPNIELTLAYIDDVVKSFIATMLGEKVSSLYSYVDVEHRATLGEVVELIKSFKVMRETQIIPNLSNPLAKKLYSTYLSYLSTDNFDYKLDKKTDNRGWLAELVKSKEFGQIFVSKTKPGITRGNHYHHTKVEKFVVISGEAEIRFRHIKSDEVIVYKVNGEEARVLDIPPGYTHSIVNTGNEEVITLFWSNEIFDQKNPDTFYCEV